MSASSRLACVYRLSGEKSASNQTVLNKKLVYYDPNGPVFFLDGENKECFFLQTCDADMSNLTCTGQHSEDLG